MDIFLPSKSEQIKTLLKNFSISSQTNILLLGASHYEVANKLATEYPAKIIVAVEDYDNLMLTRLNLKNKKICEARLIEFDKLDLKDISFDLIYSQGAVSTEKREAVLNASYNLLSEDGVICFGELINLRHDTPKFVADMWNLSQLFPLFEDETTDYYSKHKFEVIAEEKFGLHSFYRSAMKEFEKLDKEELKNRTLKRIKHECDVYLNLGGDKFIGFKTIIAKKIL